jgi:hypothetical protein
LPSSALRMAMPFPRTMPQAIKIEDEGNHAPYGRASVEKELMDIFRNIVPPPPVRHCSSLPSLLFSAQTCRFQIVKPFEEVEWSLCSFTFLLIITRSVQIVVRLTSPLKFDHLCYWKHFAKYHNY